MENNNKTGRENYFISIYLGFFGLFALLLALVLVANGGTLSFVLDDPFIHLALAEHILQGHYGVNAGEASAAASSILWPFILAPFTALPQALSVYAALLLNLLFAGQALRLFVATLTRNQQSSGYSRAQIILFSWLFIIFANLFSLIFIGMEHALQLYLSLIIVAALLAVVTKGEAEGEIDGEGKKPEALLYVAIIAAPLIRYECLALSAPALLLLWLKGFKKQAALTAVVCFAALVAFSLYLKSLGLDYLPSSILLKSNNEASLFASIARRFSEHLLTPKFYLLVIFLCLSIKLVLDKKALPAKRTMAGFTVMAVSLFLLFGRFGWYYRYEIFLWAPMFLLCLYLYSEPITAWLKSPLAFKRKCLVFFAVLMIGFEHIAVTLAIPMAANNIYLQQQQMARFVADYYPKPVAVNDLGSVAFASDSYVLDLWGLASQEALAARKAQEQSKPSANDVSWMQQLVAKHNVGLAMIYYSDTGNANGWFEKVPSNWIKLGELQMTALGVSVSKREVVFFATSEKAAAELRPKLEVFSKTLPRLSHFEFAEN